VSAQRDAIDSVGIGPEVGGERVRGRADIADQAQDVSERVVGVDLEAVLRADLPQGHVAVMEVARGRDGDRAAGDDLAQFTHSLIITWASQQTTDRDPTSALLVESIPAQAGQADRPSDSSLPPHALPDDGASTPS
jgi:hypothetical protein